MREVIIDFPPNRKITINGAEYEVKLSDIEALELAAELAADYSELSSGEPERVLAVIKRTIAVLDTLFGEGASSAITGGRSLSAGFMLGSIVTPVFKAVFEEAGDEYAGRIAENYE